MDTPPPPRVERTDGSPVRIGALVPLTRPGWVEAGRHLLAGMELAVRDVADAGGIGGRPLELVVRDTAADPDRAAAAVDELVSYPEPAVPIVRSVRRDPRLAGVLIGAPTGQPELGWWASSLGVDGAGVPFLRYLPERLGPLGARVEAALRERLAEAPCFIAFEGYDTITVLADVLRTHGLQRERVAAAWPRVAVDGTRGTIRFAQAPGVSGWQWAWPPIQVVDRDPARPDRFRVLHAGPAGVIVALPTTLVARYRAVDRELVGSPIIDTPAHLDVLTASVREHGILVPLRLGFTTDSGALDGNHRIAVALRLGLPEVPVELVREPPDRRPGHSRPMRPEDLAVLVAAYEGAAGHPAEAAG